jgi:TonB family protein
MMATGAQVRGWDRPSRRRTRRFVLQEWLDVTVSRLGITETLPGRSLNLCESGIGAVLAGKLLPGETVGVEMQLAPETAPLRTNAKVRYEDKLRYGFEFLSMTEEQRAAIQDWVKEKAKAEAEAEAEVAKSSAEANSTNVDAEASDPVTEQSANGESASSDGGDGSSEPPRNPRKRGGWILGFALLAIAGGLLWWKWNRDWQELERGKTAASAAVKPQAQVSAEVMQQLLVHRVEPAYPAAARQQNLEGVIALDVVVSRDGSVESVRALNGPEVLAQAAMDALRWWKFQPYRINGEPAVVETTLAVEFKK